MEVQRGFLHETLPLDCYMSRVLKVDAVKDYGLTTILLSANAATCLKMLMDLMNYVDEPVLEVLVDLVECFPIKFVSYVFMNLSHKSL